MGIPYRWGQRLVTTSPAMPLRVRGSPCNTHLPSLQGALRWRATSTGAGAGAGVDGGNGGRRARWGVDWLEECSASLSEGPLEHDAVVVLAGGQTQAGSGLPLWVERRLDAAASIAAAHATCRPPLVCLGGGTPHRPPIISGQGFVVHESTACADYLVRKCAVPPHRVLKEVSSYDTIGNAFFALTLHTVPAAWRRLAVVTSSFHLPRTQDLFDSVYALAATSIYADPTRFQLVYYSVSDDGVFPDDVLAARRQREAQSLARWQQDKQQLTSLSGFHAWLHHTHLCYAVTRQSEFGQPTNVDDKALASY